MASSSEDVDMEDSEIEIPACPVCQEEFDEQIHPYILDCGHTMCGGCMTNMKNFAAQQGQGRMNCPTCRRPCIQANVPKNFKLAEAITVIKKLKKKPDPPKNSVKCINYHKCQKIENEADMFVCRDCTNEAYGYDVIGTLNPDTDLDPKTIAVCGTCAIVIHVSQKHEIIPYFPISSALHFQSQFASVNCLREELNLQVMKACGFFSDFRKTAENFNKELDKMTEMMRRSRSSTVQQEFTKRIEKSISDMSTHIQVVGETIGQSNSIYQEKLEALAEMNRKDEESKCSEVAETKTETVCSQCTSKQPVERFLCCKTCSEVVEKLIGNLLDSSEIDSVVMDTLPICPNCIVQGHIGAGHQTVKFQEVQNKFKYLKRLVQAGKHSNALTSQFSGLLETFRHYTSMIETYEDNIAKMSKIAMESRGIPEHEQIVLGLEQCLDSAESAILNMGCAQIAQKSTKEEA